MPQDTPPRVMSQSSKRFVQSLYDLFKEGDIETFIGHLDADVTWIEAEGFPTAGTFESPEAVLEGVFGPLAEAVPDFQAIPETFVADGDDVVALGTYTGTHAETGESFEARFAHHYTVDGGAVTRFEQVVDSVPVRAAWGP